MKQSDSMSYRLRSLTERLDKLEKLIGVYEVPKLPPEPDIDRIILAVEHVYGLYPGEIMNKKRCVPLPDARLHAMYEIDQLGIYKRDAISRMFNLSGDGIVLRANRLFKDRVNREKVMKDRYEQVKKMLNK